MGNGVGIYIPDGDARERKVEAWDQVGLAFWHLGRESAKPGPKCVEWFAQDGGSRCLVVGGTTIDLIERLAERGAQVCVLDFSRRVCQEAAEQVSLGVTVVHGDALDPPREVRELGSYDAVLCDTLINRFDSAEALAFARTSAGLLRSGGRLRATVFEGRYPMDERMIDTGRAWGCLERFWEETTQTIDFARAGREMLEQALLPHGDLPRETLVQWYLGRGREKRFGRAELEGLFDNREWRSVEVDRDEERPSRLQVTAVRA